MKTVLTLLRMLGLFVLLGFAACALTPLPNLAAGWLAGETTALAAGAIVVLGADARGDGTLGNSSLRRTVVALQQYRLGMAPIVVFTGASRASAVSEAMLRQQLARQLLVPADAIITDDRPQTTREEAQTVKTLLTPRGVRAIVLVTDSLHIRRAREAFEREGFEVGAVAADSIALGSSSPEDRLGLTRAVVQQTLALLVYRLRDWSAR